MAKTTVTVSREDVEFLKDYGISPSGFANKLIRLVMEGKMEAPKRRTRIEGETIVISLQLPDELHEYVKRNGINMSALLRVGVKKLKRLLA